MLRANTDRTEMDTQQVEQRVMKLLKSDYKEAHITFIRLAYTRREKCYVLFLSADKLLPMAVVLELERLLKLELAELQPLKIQVAQPGEELLKKPGRLAQTVKEFMVREEPALIPFVQTSKVLFNEKGGISIHFAHPLGPHFVERMDIAGKLHSYLKDHYALDVRVTDVLVSEMDADETKAEDISRLFDNHLKKEPVKEPKRAPQPAPPPSAPSSGGNGSRQPWNGSGGKPRNRNRKKMDGEITRIIDLIPEEEALIKGDVISSEEFVTRDGKNTIITLTVTDYTSTVRCRKFIRGAGDGICAPANKGDHVLLLGRYVYNTYNREYIINMNDVVIEEKEVKVDAAEEKRVELHLHTNMSAQDGMASASAYINRAAEWGHKAIAITDHGVVQAFPEAANAAKNHPDLKVIFGVEAYMVDVPKRIYKGREHAFSEEFVVFDIETTGLSKENNEIIEIGAVRVRNGEVLDRFQSFIKPKFSIPYEITKLTGITDDMVKDAPEERVVLEAFWAFAGDTCLVAHNAAFDTGFVFGASGKHGMVCKNDVVDTLLIARVHLKELKSKALNRLAKHYKIPLEHHRAVNDAMCTASIFYAMLREIEAEKGFTKLSELNYLVDTAALAKSTPRPNHMILLCKNKTGLTNLYRLISMSHLDYFYRRPRMPKNEIAKHREGLIIGSACEQGELYQAVLKNEKDDILEEIASFYDYLEIQPHGNNDFMIRNGTVKDIEQLTLINKRIYELGKRLGIPVVATGDVHFLEERDAYYRRILMETSGFKDADNQAPLYYRTTDEMLREFAYLGEEAAREVVIHNPNAIAAKVEHIDLFPGETAMPTIENADVEIREEALKKMHAMYGNPLPKHIEERLFKELDSVIKHGYAVLYWISMKLVRKSMADGYLVGSRGSVGSSLAAFAIDVSEVNPLPPHYLCPNCRHSDFDVDKTKYGCGFDMPEATCPHCGAEYIRDGFDIPFEVFLGLNAEKVPDIDLNFSGEYRATANKYIEELFGEEFVYRAGTISAIKENTAKGLVRKFMEMEEMEIPQAEIERLAGGISGVKKTTGQHPGGLVIVPRDREVYEFTPIQKPADKMAADTITTHFDFNSMHDILVKLDILGHDNPTILRMLQDMTGLEPLKLPINDAQVLSLFNTTEAIGLSPEQLRGIEFGVLGIPEFGTKPTMRILKKTMPTTISELVRISGLSHGTDVWTGNAEDLILSGTTTLSGAICTRDDIMNSLVAEGVDHQRSFFIMESVRKGMWAKGWDKNQEEHEAAMREAGVDEWFIESCRKIQYMFPKAHAAAYVVNALRIAYFKVYYPKEFYAAALSIRVEDFDAETILGGVVPIQNELDRLEALGMKQSATEKSAVVVLELALEMIQRGFSFLAPDLKKSSAKRFLVEGESLRLPFMALPMLGEKAAITLEEKAAEMEFSSIEEVKKECKLSQTVIETMKGMGCFGGLPEKAQLSLFEALGL